MTHVIADRVSDTSTTTGTGAFTVSGSAPTGFRTLSAVLSNADTFYYVIAHQSANEWEVGKGTHSGGNVFARTTPIASSSGGSTVDFASGTKDVFLPQPAARDNPRLSGLTDNTLARYDGPDGNLQGTGIVVDDTTNDVSVIGNITPTTGSALRAATAAGNTLLLQARDVDGSTYTTFVTLTSNDTPTCNLSTAVTHNSKSIFNYGNTWFGQCVLSLSGGSLLLAPYQGNRITINSSIETIADAGITLSASGLSTSTLYYIYVYMNSGTMTLEASATAHATQAGTGVEIKSGDATRTLVGMVYVVTGPAFADTDAQRYVRSWFNRNRPRNAAVYSTSRTTTSTSLVELNTEIRIGSLMWNGEVWETEYAGSCSCSSTGEALQTSIAIDSATVGSANAYQAHTATFAIPHFTTFRYLAAADGQHFATILGLVTAGTGTWIVSSFSSSRLSGRVS